jgi:hypothetical protein
VEAIQADGTTAAKVTGRVEGTGQNRRLRYSVAGLPAGSKVSFVEAGRGGGGAIGAVTKSGSGTLPFHPAAGAPGKREVQGLVTAADGFISARVVLGTYTAPSPPRPGRATKLSFKVVGKKLVLRWRAGLYAVAQQVDIRTKDGLNITRIVKRSTTSLPLPAPGTKLTVLVTGTSQAQVPGTPARFTKSLPKAKKKAVKPKKKATKK